MRRHWFSTVISASALIVGTLLQSVPTTAQNKVIRIVTQSPLTGDQGAQGGAIRDGTLLAIEQLGGRLRDQGFDIQFEAYDDQAIERVVEVENGAMPTRRALAAEVRATTDYEGLTGIITFDDNGDREIGNYFVIEVTSTDPTRWSQNAIIGRLEILSPLADEAEF
ncbi:MAG: hypothetical protein SGJ24_19460 [Chloroflexota bacterium]|nr:hypothetical protein [Chloroflexota bacterium]